MTSGHHPHTHTPWHQATALCPMPPPMARVPNNTAWASNPNTPTGQRASPTPHSVVATQTRRHFFSNFNCRLSRNGGEGKPGTCNSTVGRILLNSLDCWSFKTLNQDLNHLKIHTAHQFCDFQGLPFFGNQVWLNLYKWVLSGNELWLL